MRTGIFLITTLILTVTIKANTRNILNSGFSADRKHAFNNKITFIEKGIEFHVFLNGDFDFNTHFRDNSYEGYRSRRTRINRRVRIERGYSGKIRRIGNVFVNYNIRGNVTRIGGVFMRYSAGNLVKIGGLRIHYNRWGDPFYEGRVRTRAMFDDRRNCDNSINIDINIGDIYNYDDLYFYKKSFRNNYSRFREDNNFFYYRAMPNANIGNRSRIIRRRKSNNSFKNTIPEQEGRSRRNR